MWPGITVGYCTVLLGEHRQIVVRFPVVTRIDRTVQDLAAIFSFFFFSLQAFSKIYVTKTPSRDYLGNKQDKDETFDPLRG
jgi:hypothetical protein